MRPKSPNNPFFRDNIVSKEKWRKPSSGQRKRIVDKKSKSKSPPKKYPFRSVDESTFALHKNQMEHSHFSKGKLPASYDHRDERDMKHILADQGSRRDAIKLRPILHAMPGQIRTHANIKSEDLMNEWLESYDGEIEQFNSLTLELEIKMKRAAIFTKNLQTPNKLRTAVAWECLDKLGSVMGRFSNVFGMIQRELEEAIFLPSDNDTTSQTTSGTQNSQVGSGTVAQCVERMAYFEETSRLEKERSKVLDFAANLQKELENWEREKHESAAAERKAVAETAWGHIIKRGHKEKKVAKLLHTVASAHAAFKVEQEEEDDVKKMVKQMRLLNYHDQVEVIEILCKQTKTPHFLNDVVTVSATEVRADRLCKLFVDIFENKDLPMTEIQRMLLRMTKQFSPKEKNHLMSQILSQFPCGDEDIKQARVLKYRHEKKQSAMQLDANEEPVLVTEIPRKTLGEKEDGNHPQWDLEALHNLLHATTKLENAERFLSLSYENNFSNVHQVMQSLVKEIVHTRTEINVEFSHDMAMKKAMEIVEEDSHQLQVSTRAVLGTMNKKGKEARMVELLNVRNNLIMSLEELKSIVLHRIDPCTNAAKVTQRVGAVHALLVSLTDMEFHDLLERTNLVDKEEHEKTIKLQRELQKLLGVYVDATKTLATQNLDTVDAMFANMHNLKLMDTRYLPIPDFDQEDLGSVNEVETPLDGEVDGAGGDQGVDGKDVSPARLLGAEDVSVDSHERSKQKAAQQLLLAWLKYLSDPTHASSHVVYDPGNTDSFEVLADGGVLSKAVNTMISQLPANQTRICCTGLGRVAMVLENTAADNAGVLVDLRSRAWSMNKKHAYNASITNQLSYTKLMASVYTAVNGALGIPKTIWTLDELRAMEPDPIFSVLGFLYSTYPSLQKTAGKSEALQIALERNRSFWDSLKLSAAEDGTKMLKAVEELLEIQATTKTWMSDLVTSHGKYETSRSAILAQVFAEFGRRIEGRATAARANEEGSHEAQLTLHHGRLPGGVLRDLNAADIEAINKIVHENSSELYQVYRAYAAMGRTSNGTVLGRAQFLRFSKDTISDGSLTSGFRTADYGIAFDTMAKKGDGFLGLQSFVPAIVLNARKYFKSDDVSTSVETYVDLIITRANKSDVDRFRSVLRESNVNRVIRKYMVRMKSEYKKFTRKSKTGTKGMTIRDFKKYVEGKGLRQINSHMNESMIRTIFNHVQRSSSIDVETLGDDADDTTADDDDEIMDFKEFTEAFVAIALFTYASPFIAVEQRIEKLFHEIFPKGRK